MSYRNELSSWRDYYNRSLFYFDFNWAIDIQDGSTRKESYQNQTYGFFELLYSFIDSNNNYITLNNLLTNVQNALKN